MEEFKIALGAEIKPGELDDIKNQINKAKTDPIKIDIDKKYFDSQLAYIKKQIQSIGNIKLNLGKGLNLGNLTGNFGNINKQIGTIKTTVGNSINTIKDMQQTLASMKFDRSSIDLVTKDLENMNLVISNITTKINKNGLNLSIKGVDELGRTVNVIKQFDYETGKISTVGKTISQTFANSSSAVKEFTETLEKAQMAFKDGSIEASISKVSAKYTELANTGHEKLSLIETDIRELTSLQEQMGNSQNDNDFVNSYEKYNEVLSRVKNSLSVVDDETKAYKREVLETAKAQETLSKSQTLSNNIQTWMNQNKKAAEQYGDALKKIQRQLDNNSNSTVFKNASLEFSKIKSEAKAAGITVDSFGQSLKETAKQLLNIGSTVAVIQTVVRVLRQMYDEVYAIDTALTELYKVTDETPERYNQYLNNAKSTAQELGRTISSYVNQTATWAKLGYGISEAEQLSKISSIYANVGDVDDKTAVSDMVTAMKAFNLEASDSVSIIDALNELGNRFATSAGDLGTGLSRSASSLHNAGVDLNQTLALLTGGAEITQNADEFGNFLKISSMRIRGRYFSCPSIGNNSPHPLKNAA